MRRHPRPLPVHCRCRHAALANLDVDVNEDQIGLADGMNKYCTSLVILGRIQGSKCMNKNSLGMKLIRAGLVMIF